MPHVRVGDAFGLVSGFIQGSVGGDWLGWRFTASYESGDMFGTFWEKLMRPNREIDDVQYILTQVASHFSGSAGDLYVDENWHFSGREAAKKFLGVFRS